MSHTMISLLLHLSSGEIFPYLPTWGPTTTAVMASAQLAGSLQRCSVRQDTSSHTIIRWGGSLNMQLSDKAKRDAVRLPAWPPMLQAIAAGISTLRSCLRGSDLLERIPRFITTLGTIFSSKLSAANASIATPLALLPPSTPSLSLMMTACAPTAVQLWTTTPPAPSHSLCSHLPLALRLSCSLVTACSFPSSTGTQFGH
jgi:hypothetical protein